MVKKKSVKIALVGNPNSGKSSLFNHLTGLNQKVGNFPGVTVDKKIGSSKLSDDLRADFIDLPGTYSLYPRSIDERVVVDILLNKKSVDHPDIIVVIADAANLKRNLLLFSQVMDLEIPVILALNMLDVSVNLGQKVKSVELARNLGVPVVALNARIGEGISLLKQAILEVEKPRKPFIDAHELAPETLTDIEFEFGVNNHYEALLIAQQGKFSTKFDEPARRKIAEINLKNSFNHELVQSKEILKRYEKIDKIIAHAVEYNVDRNKNLTEKIDKVLTHKIFGYLIFLSVLFVIFQSIFTWASYPMDLIDGAFASMASWIKTNLPNGLLVDLLSEGIIPGIGGIVIFIPQIALLFAFIAILEESGYMSRVVFLMDKIMRKFGLNGKSVVPLISGVACAIPAIMATRTISNWKERLITIFVTPFMSCSARLPVYTILIALVVPEEKLFSVLSLQAVVLMALYLLGFFMAIFSAWILKLIINTSEKSYFIMELPLYKFPRWNHVGITLYEKSRTFVVEAGKIILAISIILWVLASFPKKGIENAVVEAREQLEQQAFSESDIDKKLDAIRLENSYAGMFGKSIEPAIKPLGYDWKIGIALITSFAAREVFVGTMATIYSIGADNDDESTIKKRMRAEMNPETGQPRYNMAVAFSLLVFYAFAMQCMSTLAIVWRETKSWKYPIYQLIYMSGIAYFSSLIVYQLMK